MPSPEPIDEQARVVRPLDPSRIRRSPYQVRAEEPADPELRQSIATHGLLNPLTVRADEDGEGYELIAGHRRLAAWIAAMGTAPVPCIVLDADDRAAEDLLVAENLVRRDLTPIEEALTVAQLRAHGRTIEQVAAVTRKSERWVYRRSAIADIGEPWRPHLAALRASYPRCLALARLPAPLRSEAWDSYLAAILRGAGMVDRDADGLHYADTYRDGLLAARGDARAWARALDGSGHGAEAEAAAEAWWRDERRGLPALEQRLRPLDARCPFDAAGCGDCRGCTQRTDRQPDLWADDERGAAAQVPRCLDPDCYSRHIATAPPSTPPPPPPAPPAPPPAPGNAPDVATPRTPAAPAPERPAAPAVAESPTPPARPLPPPPTMLAEALTAALRLGAYWMADTLCRGSMLDTALPAVGQLVIGDAFAAPTLGVAAHALDEALRAYGGMSLRAGGDPLDVAGVLLRLVEVARTRLGTAGRSVAAELETAIPRDRMPAKTAKTRRARK